METQGQRQIVTEPIPGARLQIGKQNGDKKTCFLKGNHMSQWGSQNNKAQSHNDRLEDADTVEQ